MAKKKSIHYVDNKKFHEEMVAYKNHCADVKKKDPDADVPIIPDYIGDCFMRIAERLSLRPNFVNYAFRDEMISDGIENCVQSAHNFNPEKSSNPFSYFTQIIYYAFIRRIQKEKKQLYIKYKSIHNNSMLSDSVALSEHDDSNNKFNVEVLTEEQKANIYKFVGDFEASIESKKVKKTSTSNTLMKFVEDAEPAT
tara:strand:+ start:1189 stop:1776 length:588 start_codon:yes stop_codon:yes gene_type:complete